MNLLEFRCRLRYPSGFQIDADFAAGSVVTALFGPSGSGKTSILSMIAGLRQPDEGFIRLKDRVLFDSRQAIRMPPEARRIGYVFQKHLLFPHLSVERNLQYGWQRRPADAQSVQFDRVVEILELSDLLPRLPHTLSGGQSQRVALGRALLCSPELLLFDEPVSSLEDDLKDRVLNYIRDILQEWRIPTLYVTHDRREIQQIAESVVELQQGRVVERAESGERRAESRTRSRESDK
jgi:molybdate transport system ATP-binding protein